MEQVNKRLFVSLNLLIVIIFLINWSLAANISFNRLSSIKKKRQTLKNQFQKFDYKNVDYWELMNPQCGGKRQSPVSINYEQLDKRESDVRFSTINYYNKPLSAKLLNDGHSIKVQFVWDKNETPFLAGDVFGGKEYVLDSIHFHWSRISRHGSEHRIFGYGGAMEMHLVHYNRDYRSVQNASNFNDGLAVIGCLFESVDALWQLHDNDYENSKVFQESPAINKIINNVESVSTPGSSVDIEPFAITDVGPVHFHQSTFISYLGSLTTPPCTENVLWLLALYPYHITEEQLQFLQSAVNFDYGDDHNYRPVQPINGRTFSVFVGSGAFIN